MNKHTINRILLPTVLFIMAASLVVTLYFFFVQQPATHFTELFGYRVETYVSDLAKIRREARPRIGSSYSFALLRHVVDLPIERIVAFHFSAWFALLAGLAFWLLRSPRTICLMLLGTVCAVVYAGSPIAEATWCPWDMPALTLSGAALLLAISGRFWLIVPLVILGGLFKETVLLGAVFLLGFDRLSWRSRIALAASTLLAGYLLRHGVEIWVDVPKGLDVFSFRDGDDQTRSYRWITNIKILLSRDLNHVAWVNAGLIFTVLFLPVRSTILRLAKLQILLLYAGLFLAGRFVELRIFFEALPASLLVFDHYLKNIEEPAAQNQVSS